VLRLDCPLSEVTLYSVEVGLEVTLYSVEVGLEVTLYSVEVGLFFIGGYTV
jgi:hypothetical protein